MFIGESRVPAGTRVYVLGDVHGMAKPFTEAHARISRDLKENPPENYAIVHIGDYVDRGPESKLILDTLIWMEDNDPRVINLRGNHDQMMLDFLLGNDEHGLWLNNGGEETLTSYGIKNVREKRSAELLKEATSVISDKHRHFLHGLNLSAMIGDYFFVHAGVRPGRFLHNQSPNDMLWIREEFLDFDGDHGFVVVHGHTPVYSIHLAKNRINVDTGVVFSQWGDPTLPVLVLEDNKQRIL